MIKLLFLFIFTSIQANEIRLFYKKDSLITPTLQYSLLTKEIKKDDVLIFPDGKSFKIISKLGAGGTTYIYKVRKHNSTDNKIYALRVAQTNNDIGYIKAWYKAYKKLVTSEISIPILYSSLKETKGSYALIEYIDIDEDLQTFLSKYNKRESKNDIKKVLALYKFANSTYNFSIIGDFRAEQIVYDKLNKSWRLIDFTKDVSIFSGYNFKSSFNNKNNLTVFQNIMFFKNVPFIDRIILGNKANFLLKRIISSVQNKRHKNIKRLQEYYNKYGEALLRENLESTIESLKRVFIYEYRYGSGLIEQKNFKYILSFLHLTLDFNKLSVIEANLEKIKKIIETNSQNSFVLKLINKDLTKVRNIQNPKTKCLSRILNVIKKINLF